MSAAVRRLNSTVNSVFYGALFLGFQRVVGNMVRGFAVLNTEIENATVGIAGLLTGITQAPIATTMKVARQEVAFFRREAAKLPGELPDYIQAYQLVAGPAFRAGATRKQAQQLARLSVLAGSLTPTGRGMKTLPIDVLQALAGSAHQTNTRDLLTLLGMDAKAFNKLSQGDRLSTLIDRLGRLEPAARVAGATWDAQMATLRDNVKQVLRTLTGPLFGFAKRSLAQLNLVLEAAIPKWEFFLSHVGNDAIYWVQGMYRTIRDFDYAGAARGIMTGAATYIGLMSGISMGASAGALVGGGLGALAGRTLGATTGASIGAFFGGPMGAYVGWSLGDAFGEQIGRFLGGAAGGGLGAYLGGGGLATIFNALANFAANFPGHLAMTVYAVGNALFQLGRVVYHLFQMIGNNPVVQVALAKLFQGIIGAFMWIGNNAESLANRIMLYGYVFNTVSGYIMDFISRISEIANLALAGRWGEAAGKAATLATGGGRLVLNDQKQRDREFLNRLLGLKPLTPFTGFFNDDGSVDFDRFLDALTGAGDTNINGPVTIQIRAERLDNPDVVARSFQEAMDYLRDYRREGRSFLGPRTR